jgi:hypothetical protein
MKLRFVLFAFVLPGFVAAAVVGAALWLVAVAYDDLGDALEGRKRHLQASAALVRLLVPAKSEAESQSAELDAIQQQWRQAGASDEELTLLDDALDRRRKLQEFAAATMPGSVEAVKGAFANPARTQPERAFIGSVQHEAGRTKLVSDVSRLVELADARTTRAVDAAWRELGHAIGIAIAGVALLLLATIVAAVLLRRSLLVPIRRLAHDITGAAQRNDDPAPLDPATRIPEFHTIANAYNTLAQALEDEIRARLRMAVELQRARSAADTATRTGHPVVARSRDQHATDLQAAVPSRDVQDLDSENTPARLNIAEPRGKPRGSKRRRRNPNV